MEKTDIPGAPAASVLAAICVFYKKECPSAPNGRPFSCLFNALQVLTPFDINLVFSVPPKTRGDQSGPCPLTNCTWNVLESFCRNKVKCHFMSTLDFI